MFAMKSALPKIFVSIVYYNSLTQHGPDALKKSLDSLLNQDKYELGRNLLVSICDNASVDQSVPALESILDNRLPVRKNSVNLGFSGAHNQAVAEFINSDCEQILFFNPDLFVFPDTLSMLSHSLSSSAAAMATPKLMRGDANLNVTAEANLDAAGMYLTSALRHFDRGSDTPDAEQYSTPGFVFGGTGACLLIKKEAVQALLLPEDSEDSELFKIYPHFLQGHKQRAQLFDEAFLAYREDADLAYRAQSRGLSCLYVPAARGIHKRVVLSANRAATSAENNFLGVRNRFLLQINNFHLHDSAKAFFMGIIFRNLLVIAAVLFREHSSLRAFADIFKLLPRAKRIRKENARKRVCNLSKWFKNRIIHEKV